MIPAPVGTVAYYDGPYALDGNPHEIPVVAFDEDGTPLVAGHLGRLTPASDLWRKGWTFAGVHVPTSDPVVAIEHLDDPVAIETSCGADEALGWAFRASGAVSPIIDDKGTPWVYSDQWCPYTPTPAEGAA